MAGLGPGKVIRSETAEMCSAVRRAVRESLRSWRSAACSVGPAWRGWAAKTVAEAVAAPAGNNAPALSRAQAVAAAVSRPRVLLRAVRGMADLMSAPRV